ncbi:Serine/threonine-protein kinase 32C [Tolypocladium ophioglossoides CBS 100239]|uniref:Serine/threonine-protein kinase 32C n=1 Tax=Tolypocladium ophioglossoides (strain CBS 100239) TaxID=1163406 RepID=A0A0L0N9I7_TOLOC|nr:Serine/threonine-protein kinase 32C [Tolypocladium ophioglossoides CBS 100239]
MGNGQGKPVDLTGEGTWFAGTLSRLASTPLSHVLVAATFALLALALALAPALHSWDARLGQYANVDSLVNLNHFRLLRVVGRGAFGKVRIVERKDTNLSFALKYIRKDEVVKSESVRNIIRERRMLEHVNHPFICNLRYSFQDIEYMYLVVDLMSGGDLRFHISRKTFTEEAVRFWIAELGCALRYVHRQGIIHRDVKPDNVLLDADGHVHLTDFNVASDIIPGRILTSKSGTLAYLSPERPFDGSSEATLSQQIQTTSPKYHVTQPPVSLTCLYSIRAALDPNPQTRMGATWESFIYNDFFKELDFDLLEQKRIEPIFVPSSDKTNFDATYDLEELLLEEAPLEARARRQKPRERLKEDATDQEIREDELYRMIEKDFRPFDYTIAAYKKCVASTPERWTQVLTHDSRIALATQGVNIDESPLNITPNDGPQAITTDESPRVPIFPPTALDRGPSFDSRQGRPSRPAPPPPPPPPPPQYQSQYVSRALPPTSNRVASPTGGVSVTLDGGGSWSELARQDATLPTDANTVVDPKNEGSGGMFGFLKGKKGRNNSPKPKERGVLGKEGARVVIS